MRFLVLVFLLSATLFAPVLGDLVSDLIEWRKATKVLLQTPLSSKVAMAPEDYDTLAQAVNYLSQKPNAFTLTGMPTAELFEAMLSELASLPADRKRNHVYGDCLVALACIRYLNDLPAGELWNLLGTSRPQKDAILPIDDTKALICDLGKYVEVPAASMTVSGRRGLESVTLNVHMHELINGHHKPLHIVFEQDFLDESTAWKTKLQLQALAALLEKTYEQVQDTGLLPQENGLCILQSNIDMVFEYRDEKQGAVLNAEHEHIQDLRRSRLQYEKKHNVQFDDLFPDLQTEFDSKCDEVKKEIYGDISGAYGVAMDASQNKLDLVNDEIVNSATEHLHKSWEQINVYGRFPSVSRFWSAARIVTDKLNEFGSMSKRQRNLAIAHAKALEQDRHAIQVTLPGGNVGRITFAQFLAQNQRKKPVVDVDAAIKTKLRSFPVVPVIVGGTVLSLVIVSAILARLNAASDTTQPLPQAELLSGVPESETETNTKSDGTSTADFKPMTIASSSATGQGGMLVSALSWPAVAAAMTTVLLI